MVETFKEYFFGAHKISAFLVIITICTSLILQQWIMVIIGLVFFPILYFTLYQFYKKSMSKFDKEIHKPGMM